MPRLPLYWIALFVGLIGLIAVAVRGPAQATGVVGDASAYRYGTIERRDLRSAVAATGTLEPVATVLVGSQISGQVRELRADFNSRVRRGEIIAVIDPASFEIALEQAEADLRSTQANLQKAQVALRDAESDVRRKHTLMGSGAVSPAMAEKAEAARDLAKAQVEDAAAAVDRARAVVKHARVDLDRTRIRSPVDGVVIERNVAAGQTVASSLQAPTLFTIAQDLRDMQVKGHIDEAEIGRIAPGQAVEFTVDAYPGRRYRGVVHQIQRAPQTSQNVVTYTAIVRVANPDLSLLPGMTANAQFILAEQTGVLAAPNAALRFQPTGARAASGHAVWVDDNGALRRIPVQTGLTDGALTQVAGPGLRPGARVAVGEPAKKESKSAGKRLIGAL